MDKALKGVAVLGSTGSVGTQALDVLRGLDESLRVVAIAAGRNVPLLREQIDSFQPLLSSCDADADPAWLEQMGRRSQIRFASLTEIATHPSVDIVVLSTSGTVGLTAALAALAAGKTVALANKEILVIAGCLLTAAAQRAAGEIRPVDSEHSAIWQCLWGEKNPPSRLMLTASGGAFRDRSLDDLLHVGPAEALCHPTWQMGPKITVDSATLLNKGLETIEARWLFGVPMDQIEVLLHRESIVHSLVGFADGSVKAQLGYPDMRLPIQCALTYPDRLSPERLPRLDLADVGSLSFGRIDAERFPCLELAMDAGRRGGTYPAALVAADEVAVDYFLAGRLGFMDIAQVVEATLAHHHSIDEPTVQEIVDAGVVSHSWAEDWVASHLSPRGRVSV